MNDGIYLNNSNRHIIAQNTVSSNARYGINLDTVLYSSINGNTCNLNLTGIYILNSTNNSISNNICNQNTEHGIYIHSSSYNTISGNTCENNDSNTGNDQAGMYITNNSSFNTISGNSLNNNNNIGVGDGFGLVIATNTCLENVVASNNANGNDIDFKDAGLRTVIKYYVQSGDELQDAIDSIGTGAGTVVITTGVLTLTATILVNGGGFYIIEGEGDGTIIDCGGNRTAFNITNAMSGTTLRNFRIDATDLTFGTTHVVVINEGSDNKITINNLTIVGDGTNGYGIFLNSDNCIIERCWIQDVRQGIYLDTVLYCKIKENTSYSNNYHGIYLSESNYNTIKDNISYDNARDGIHVITSSGNTINGNVCYNNTFVGIHLKTTANYNAVSGNTCYNNSEEGIYINVAHNNSITGNICNNNGTNGIWLHNSDNNTISGNTCNDNDLNDGNLFAGIYLSIDSDYNTISGNTCNNNNNIGAGTGHGIYITENTCDDNTVIGNTALGNDTNYVDNGTNTFDSAGANPLNNFILGAG